MPEYESTTPEPETPDGSKTTLEGVGDADWLDLASEWKDQIAFKYGMDAWERLGGRHKDMVLTSLVNLARLRVLEAAGNDVSASQGIVEATLKNLAAEAGIVLARTFAKVLADSLRMAGSILKGILGNIQF